MDRKKNYRGDQMSEQVLNEDEKKHAVELLDELAEIKGPGPALDDWNIRAKTLLVFIVIRHPEIILEANG
jgi:hypothetical protein